MKLCLVFLAIVGLSWGAPRVKTSRALVDDLAEFTALIPTTDIMALFLDYLSNDLETQELMAYLQGPEVASLISYLESQPEFTELINWLISKGLDPVTTINSIHDILGLPPYVLPTRRAASSRTVRELIDAIKALIPEDQLLALFNDKLVSSPEFKELYDRIAAQPFHDYVLRVMATTEAQNLITKLKGYGIDVDLAIQTIKDLLGWTRNSRALADDIREILALIPIDQIKVIILDFVANDAEVQTALAYIQSAEFQSILSYVQGRPEYQALLTFMTDAGLDVYGFINGIYELFGLPPPYPVPARGVSSRTFREMLDQILAITPIDQIKALFQEKYNTSPEFAAFVDKLSSPEFIQLVNDVNAMPEYQDLVNRLLALGVDVNAINLFFAEMFGWPVPQKMAVAQSSRTLEEDYAAFYALLPVDQIRAIVTNYKTTDAEVQAAIAYLESPEFKAITDAVKAAPEYQQVVQYLLSHGLDLYALLNRVAELLGIPPFIPPTRYQPHSRTFRAMLDEIKAILPTAELQAMFDDKYATSPEFTALVDSLRSPEFTAFTQSVVALPEWQDLANRLAALGVDVAAINQFFFDLFGWPLRK